MSLGDGSISTYSATVGPEQFQDSSDADPSTFELLLDDLARTMTNWPIERRRFLQGLHVAAPRPSLPATRRRRRWIATRSSTTDSYSRSRPTKRWTRGRALRRILMRLGDDGWRIGIGGFGAGNTVLNALAMLPVRFIKIDQAIVEEADPRLREMLSISAAARSVEVATIAAGIATLPELALALAHEYDFAQGPLFGVELSGPPVTMP